MPVVRSWAVREAAVSTVNAVAATSMPASRATVRTAPNRSCDQASLRMVDGPPRGGGLVPDRICDYRDPIPSS